jgi:hypothetical protein
LTMLLPLHEQGMPPFMIPSSEFCSLPHTRLLHISLGLIPEYFIFCR